MPQPQSITAPRPVFTGKLVEFDRQGEFQIETFGEFHCSTLDHPRIRYHVHIDAADDSLDQRGFLFDQLDCPTYFDQIRRSDLSCELLARKTVTDLAAMILRENPHAHIVQITTTLSPEPFDVDVTEHWTLEQIDHIDIDRLFDQPEVYA